MNNVQLVGFCLDGNKVIRPISQVKEQVMSESADRIGSLIKNLGSEETFADFMLYKPFYIAKLRLKCGDIPEGNDGIRLAFDIINKNYFPKNKKDDAIKFLSALANKMKEIEQKLIEEANKEHSILGSREHIMEKLLPVQKKEYVKYQKQAEEMVKSGKLDSNPFI